MVGLKNGAEQPGFETTEDLENAIDLAIYEERKNGEYVSEEEALEYLKQNGKL